VEAAMTEELVRLAWNSFTSNAPDTFRRAWSDGAFTDVTLASEDGHHLPAHRIVLSSCSTFFREVFLRSPSPGLVLYLRGTRRAELELVLRFVYLGQVTLRQEELQAFLQAGRELGVEGLLEDLSMKAVQGSTEEDGDQSKILKPELDGNMEAMGTSGNETDESFLTENYETIQEHKTKEGETAWKIVPEGHKGSLVYGTVQLESEGNLKCAKCDGQFFNQSDLMGHHQRDHIDTNGAQSYTSDLKASMYDCDRCDYQTSHEADLKRHLQTEHEVGRFPQSPGPLASWMNQMSRVVMMARKIIRCKLGVADSGRFQRFPASGTGKIVPSGSGFQRYGQGVFPAWERKVPTQALMCPSSLRVAAGRPTLALASILPWAAMGGVGKDFSSGPDKSLFLRRVRWKDFLLLAVELLAIDSGSPLQ